MTMVDAQCLQETQAWAAPLTLSDRLLSHVAQCLSRKTDGNGNSQKTKALDTQGKQIRWAAIRFRLGKKRKKRREKKKKSNNMPTKLKWGIFDFYKPILRQIFMTDCWRYRRSNFNFNRHPEPEKCRYSYNNSNNCTKLPIFVQYNLPFFTLTIAIRASVFLDSCEYAAKRC